MEEVLKKGDVVKFRNALNAEKAQTRMIIRSDPGGGRVLVSDISNKTEMQSLYLDELELCGKEY